MENAAIMTYSIMQAAIDLQRQLYKKCQRHQVVKPCSSSCTKHEYQEHWASPKTINIQLGSPRQLWGIMKI